MYNESFINNVAILCKCETPFLNTTFFVLNIFRKGNFLCILCISIIKFFQNNFPIVILESLALRECEGGALYLFFCHSHSHSHNDIGNVYLLFLSKQQDKHCIRHYDCDYDCDYDKKIRYKYGP